MSLIQVKFDNTLKQSDIIVPLTNSSHDESGGAYSGNKPEVQQTSVYGIQSPLIMINNIVVDFSDVIDFELKCTSITPRVSMVVKDRYKLTEIVATPGIDNELRVQVLPKFDGVYKKVNLTFFITSINFQENYVFIKGEYKLPKYTDSQIISLGELSTYNLMEKVAKDTGLGFASNMEANEDDKRYMYCDNKSYHDLLMSEIQKSGPGNSICDYWIDWWNNLVLVDIYERYNAIDPDEDIQIYVSGQQREIAEGNTMDPQKVVASLHNHPAQQFSELFITSKNIINKPGRQLQSGTDRVYTVYEHSKNDYVDYLIQDGDAQKDVFIKHEYLGEVYGDYNYLIAGKKRDTFLQKIQTNENIELTLRTPLLGLMRGNRVNLLWYMNDTATENIQNKLADDANMTDVNSLESNIPLTEADSIEDNTPDGHFILDKSISGQYLITSCKLKFYNKNWEYKIIISRPTSAKPKIIEE